MPLRSIMLRSLLSASIWICRTRPPDRPLLVIELVSPVVDDIVDGLLLRATGRLVAASRGQSLDRSLLFACARTQRYAIVQ